MLTTNQEADLCALLAGAFGARRSGNDLLVAADRMQDDGHPLADFLRAWHAKPARQGRRGWLIGSGRIGDRVTVRVTAVESAAAGACECELMVESGRRVQVWTADVPFALAKLLVALWSAAERNDAAGRVACLAEIPGGWRDHAVATARAVLGLSPA